MNDTGCDVKNSGSNFWRFRRFWFPALLVILCCIVIGYLVGNWTATSQARHTLAEQERAYKEASDARKAILEQCLNNNVKLTSQLAALGNKTATALDKLTNERN